MSYLALTMSHTKVTAVPPNEADPDWWNRFVLNLSAATNEMMHVMKEQCAAQIPCYYIRYEDLVVNPEPVLRELF